MTVTNAALAALSLLALTAAEAPPEETGIPYVGSNGIQEWQVDGDEGLYIQGITGDWYYARTMGDCPRLKTAVTLGFETSALDRLDRHGAILAQGWRCPLDSVVRVEGPPEPDR